MSAVSKLVPAPNTLLAAAFATLVLNKGRVSSFGHLKRLSVVQRIIAVIFLLNWRSWPLVWHCQLFGLIPLFRLSMRVRGIPKTFSMAESPFDKKVITKKYCSMDLSDWNGHLSNTSYGKCLDQARFQWLLTVVGPPMGPEKAWSPLAATSFVFLKEVPMFASFEIDVHVVTWDDKWIWYIARYTTSGKSRSSPRTLNALALSRSCFKLNGSRLSIPPARILSCAGLGPDMSNWERTLRLRKEGKSRAWLMYGGKQVARKRAEKGLPVNGEAREAAKDAEQNEDIPEWESDGLEIYEERRVRNLEIVQRFGDVSSDDWKNL